MISTKIEARVLGVLVIAFGLTFSTVFYAAGKKTFRHAEHLEYGATCKDCHEIDRVTKDIKHKDAACIDCHGGPVGPVQPVGMSRGPSLRFSHEVHAAAFDCKDCHSLTVSDKHVEGEPLLFAASCESCHKESGVEMTELECAKCHAGNYRKMVPSDHRRAWLGTHGRKSPWGSKVHHITDCSSCHTKSECNACHRTTKPKSHTGLWRMRTHGTKAAFDRDGCKTCHETGSCVICHKRTAPFNHRGPWTATHGFTAGSLVSERCFVCHSSSECSACHMGGQ